MALVSDQSNLFNFNEFLDYRGQYSGSYGIQDFNGSFFTVVYNSSTQVEGLNSTALVTTGFNTYYKLQGYNTTTGQYEVWYSTNSVNLIPPSGNLLSNIEVVLTWVDR